MTLAAVQNRILVPPEWAPQRAIWTAWPADPAEWNGDLEAPRRDIAAMVLALASENCVRVLVNGAEAEASARAALAGAAELVPARYGDIWLRDTGPVFARTPEGKTALRFSSNGWGGKYLLPGDDMVGDEIARLAGVPCLKFDYVLEGGAVEHDGEGTVIATRQTLLNPNRNAWSEADAEAALAEAFGASKIIWLERGLSNDHTDGHVDTIARFIGPGRVVCQSPAGPDDPNAEVLDEIATALEASEDARGRRLEVFRIPGPGLYRDAFGQVAPASHVNFVIANGVVVVPVYGTATEDEALADLQALFPERKVVGVSSRGLLAAGDAGGGSFHCITLQEPA